MKIQWWSRPAMQRLQTLQCLERAGLRRWQVEQVEPGWKRVKS
jgi:hypothetical protein